MALQSEATPRPTGTEENRIKRGVAQQAHRFHHHVQFFSWNHFVSGAEFKVATGRYAYVHVARGTIKVNGIVMQAGDGARVRDPGMLTFEDGKDAEVLVFDLRPKELPGS